MQNQTGFQSSNKDLISKDKRRGRRKVVSFNPDRKYVQEAVDYFLQQGGTIKKVEASPENYAAFVSIKDKIPAANDFLMGK